MNQSREGFVKVDDVKIYYKFQGKGDTLVMLHGNSQSSMFFKYQIAFLKKRYQVLTLDSRGHGLSSFGKKPLSISLLAKDLEKVLNILETKNIILLGFSDGANVALKMSSEFLNSLKALILVSPNIYSSAIKPFYKFFIKLAYEFCRLFKKFDYFSKKSELLSLMIKDPKINATKLKKIETKTLLIAGENDVIEKEHLVEINNAIPSCKLVVIKNASHLLLIKNYLEANKIILDFLKRI